MTRDHAFDPRQQHDADARSGDSAQRGFDAPTDASAADATWSWRGMVIDDIECAQFEAERVLARQYRWLADLHVAVVAEAHEARVDPGVMLRGAHAEVARALGWSERMVCRRMNVAEQAARQLPSVMREWESGALTCQHVEAIVAEVGGVPSADVQGFADQLLEARRQRKLTPSQLRKLARQMRETEQPQSMFERHEAARNERHLRLDPADDGMAWLSVLLPAVEASAAYQRIRAIGGSVHSKRTDPRTRGQLHVDVLRDLLIHGVIPAAEAPRVDEYHGPAGESVRQVREQLVTAVNEAPTDNGAGVGAGRGTGLGAGIVAHVNVTVPMLTLSRGVAGAESAPSGSAGVSAPEADIYPWLQGYGPIDEVTALRLAAGSSDLRRILTDPVTGVALAYGRRKYRPPKELAAYLLDRDQTCRFPGCDTPAGQCEIDHTVDWQYNGPTDATNLALLCRRHHVVKHHSAWKVHHLDDEATLLWTSPSGTRYTTSAASADVRVRARPSEAPLQTPVFISQDDAPPPI